MLLILYQWCSNFIICYSYLNGLIKYILLGSSPRVWFSRSQNSSSQTVISKPTESASSGNLAETYWIRNCGVGHSNLWFNLPFRKLIKFEYQWSITSSREGMTLLFIIPHSIVFSVWQFLFIVCIVCFNINWYANIKSSNYSDWHNRGTSFHRLLPNFSMQLLSLATTTIFHICDLLYH